jgi:hypothetical protein
MADTVRTLTVRNSVRLNGRYVVNLTNESDGTGESAVTKVDISTFTTPSGAAATYSAIERIEYSCVGMSVRLHWDADTDDTAAVLAGSGVIDQSMDGMRVDPRSAGGTGDLLLTTTGHTSGDTYDITIYMKLKA